MHLSTQVNMLPYFFIADRHNYSRWGTLYALDMLTSLPEPVSEAFLGGQFIVRQTPGSFKGIWSDMGVETSITRGSKSNSGIIGLTRSGTTVLRWTCTRHILGQYARHMEIRSGQKSSTSKLHEQSMPSMLTKDEQHTQKIVTYIRENMVDPFSVDSHAELLMNIGTGLVATPEISSALISAIDKGNKMLNAFVSRPVARLFCGGGANRLNLGTFYDYTWIILRSALNLAILWGVPDSPPPGYGPGTQFPIWRRWGKVILSTNSKVRAQNIQGHEKEDKSNGRWFQEKSSCVC